MFEVLAGARNFREIADRASDLPQELLAVAGCPTHAVTGWSVAPSEPAMRRMAHDIDADAADARICAWMHAEAMAAAIAGSAGQARDGAVGKLVAFARTTPDAGSRGVSVFVVPCDCAGCPAGTSIW